MFRLMYSAAAHQGLIRVCAAPLLAIVVLVGCGGGGGGGAPSTVQPPSGTETVNLQGIWQSPAAASTASTILLPNLTMWTVVTEGSNTRLSKVSLSAQGNTLSGTGKTYSLGSSGSSSSTFTVTGTEKLNLSQIITTGTARSTYAQTYQSRYDTPAVLSEFAKGWNAIVGTGRISWTVNAAGDLTGSSTTGCTYSGKLTERTERKAVVDVSISEVCVDATSNLSGIATVSSDKLRMSVVATTADENSAVVLSLTAAPAP